MLTLGVIRHGSTSWNERGLMQGRRDIPLSPAGRAEVARWRIPATLPKDVEWASSPLRRATETAGLLAPVPPRIEPALIEMHWGEWEGFSLDDLRTRQGRAFTDNEQRGLDFRPPGGESPRDVHERVKAWLQELAHRNRSTLAVTHLGVLRALLVAATGWDMTGKPPLKLQPGCLHRFRVESGGALSLDQCNIPLAKMPDSGAL